MLPMIVAAAGRLFLAVAADSLIPPDANPASGSPTWQDHDKCQAPGRHSSLHMAFFFTLN
jgi:hypothetical protein